jgi:hypothetical protein
MSALIEQQVELTPLSEALEQINQLPFPAVSDGDIAWHAGHRFIYAQNCWVSQPLQE